MARIVNFFAGPGVGKSMTAAALFAELKYQGHNTELISEFAKEAAWEGRGASFFDAQTYIAGVQGYKIDSVIGKVDFAITDSPMLQNLVYIPENYPAPSLRNVLREHHDAVESINILCLTILVVAIKMQIRQKMLRNEFIICSLIKVLFLPCLRLHEKHRLR
jgi:hypothetical protein